MHFIINNIINKTCIYTHKKVNEINIYTNHIIKKIKNNKSNQYVKQLYVFHLQTKKNNPNNFQ